MKLNQEIVSKVLEVCEESTARMNTYTQEQRDELERYARDVLRQVKEVDLLNELQLTKQQLETEVKRSNVLQKEVTRLENQLKLISNHNVADEAALCRNAYEDINHMLKPFTYDMFREGWLAALLLCGKVRSRGFFCKTSRAKSLTFAQYHRERVKKDI